MPNNIDIVRGVYDSLARGDVDAALASFADDCQIDLIGPSTIPFAGHYQGPSGMRQFLEKLDATCEMVDFGPDEVHGGDDFVTVLGHERARARSTQREWNTPLVDTFEVRDGKIRRMMCAYDTAAVVDAVVGPAPTAGAERAPSHART